MSAELSKCYELLGVTPGISAQGLKTAHRDLAKIWHPDRFSHEPRLQQKAQEKLQEINQAYDQIISRKKKWRPLSSPPVDRNPRSSTSTGFDQHVGPAGAHRGRWRFVILPLLVFGVVFFLTSRSLMRRNAESLILPTEQAQPLRPDVDRSSENGSSAATDMSRNKNRVDPSTAKEAKQIDTASVEPATAQLKPMATVTVMIDPATGLLARPECPVKSRMTYPTGSEPQQYCNASHPPKVELRPDSQRPKESRIKTIAKRVGSPGKWFGGSESSRQDSKSPQ